MFKYAWYELMRRRGRSLASILSYSLSVILFIVVLSLFKYSNNTVDAALKSTGTHFIAFIPSCCNLPFLKDENNEGFWANGSKSRLIPREIIAEIKKLPSVADASPFLMYMFKDSTQTNTFTVAGIEPENNISVANTSCAVTDIVKGSFIKSSDNNSVMLEQSFAKSRNFDVGQKIKIEGVKFNIIGIVNAGIRPAKADVYMPYKVAERIISRRTWNPISGQMNIVLVESASSSLHQDAIKGVSKILGDESLISTYQCYRPASNAISVSGNTLVFLTILIFILVTMLILRAQYALIVERKREIGILRSIGWTQKRIISLITIEFGTEAVSGALIGCVFSSLLLDLIPLGKILNSAVNFSLSDYFEIFISAFSISVISAFVAGFGAAWITSITNPSNNLRALE